MRLKGICLFLMCCLILSTLTGCKAVRKQKEINAISQAKYEEYFEQRDICTANLYNIADYLLYGIMSEDFKALLPEGVTYNSCFEENYYFNGMSTDYRYDCNVEYIQNIGGDYNAERYKEYVENELPVKIEVDEQEEQIYYNAEGQEIHLDLREDITENVINPFVNGVVVANDLYMGVSDTQMTQLIRIRGQTGTMTAKVMWKDKHIADMQIKVEK